MGRERKRGGGKNYLFFYLFQIYLFIYLFTVWIYFTIASPTIHRVTTASYTKRPKASCPPRHFSRSFFSSHSPAIRLNHISFPSPHNGHPSQTDTPTHQCGRRVASLVLLQGDLCLALPFSPSGPRTTTETRRCGLEFRKGPRRTALETVPTQSRQRDEGHHP